MLQRLVRLLVEQKVEALEVIDIQRRRRALRFISFAEATKRPSCRREQQKQSGEEKC